MMYYKSLHVVSKKLWQRIGGKVEGESFFFSLCCTVPTGFFLYQPPSPLHHFSHFLANTTRKCGTNVNEWDKVRGWKTEKVCEKDEIRTNKFFVGMYNLSNEKFRKVGGGERRGQRKVEGKRGCGEKSG